MFSTPKTQTQYNSHSNYNRKSLKQHQQIRIMWSLKQIMLVTVMMITLLCLYLIFTQAKGNSHSIAKTEQKIKTNQVQLKNNVEKIDLTTLYMKEYCNTSINDCKYQESQLIRQFIELLISEQNSFSPTLAVQQKTIYKHQQTKIVSNETQHKFPIQLQWSTLFNQFKCEYLNQISLFIVKHHKLTTPQPIKDTLINIFKNLFQQNDPYQEIDQIVQNQSNKVWSVQDHDFMSITVKSNKLIQPQLLEVNVQNQGKHSLSMIGLHFNFKNEMTATKLGKYQLKSKNNRVVCQKEECEDRFSMIMLIFSNVKISSIKLFELSDF